MTPEEFGAQLAAKIEAAVKALEAAANKSQDAAFNKISNFIKEFRASGGVLDNSADNYKQLSGLKSLLNGAILSDNYQQAVTDFANTYTTIFAEQNAFYSKMENGYKPGALNEEVRQAAITSTVSALTESGIEANVTSKIEQVLRDAVSTGARYSDVVKSLGEMMTNTPAGDGLLAKYIKTYATDSINTYSRVYNQIITADIGFDWFVYVGSNIETTRPFCIHMTEKRYFHKSEIPNILRGNIDGEKVSLSEKTGLPNGLKAETTTSNFIYLAGGWNCGHQIIGTNESFVPANLRAKYS